jgi:chemotaxis protein MotB
MLPKVRVAQLLALIVLVLTSGCGLVTREAYDRDIRGLGGQIGSLQAGTQALQRELADREGQIAALKDQLQALTRDATLCKDELQATKQALNATTAAGGDASKRLAGCEQSKAVLEQQIAALKAELTRTQEEKRQLHIQRDDLLRQLQKLQKELDAVQTAVKQVKSRLQKLIDAGTLRLTTRNGFLVVEVGSDILFDTGKSEIKPAARPVLAEIARAFADLRDRRFQIAGHTDNTGTDAINWRLSTDRALAVLQAMVDAGMTPTTLSAAGFGPYLPLVANDSDANRQRNRRVEFLLQPDLGQLLSLP